MQTGLLAGRTVANLRFAAQLRCAHNKLFAQRSCASKLRLQPFEKRCLEEAHSSPLLLSAPFFKTAGADLNGPKVDLSTEGLALRSNAEGSLLPDLQ